MIANSWFQRVQLRVGTPRRDSLCTRCTRRSTKVNRGGGWWMEPVADKAVGDGGVGTSPASQRVILNTLLPTLMLMCTLTDCRSPESLALAHSETMQQHIPNLYSNTWFHLGYAQCKDWLLQPVSFEFNWHINYFIKHNCVQTDLNGCLRFNESCISPRELLVNYGVPLMTHQY